MFWLQVGLFDKTFWDQAGRGSLDGFRVVVNSIGSGTAAIM